MHRSWFRKSRFTHDEFGAARLKIVEVHLHQILDHLAFATSHAGHIDLHRPGDHTQAFHGMDE